MGKEMEMHRPRSKTTQGASPASQPPVELEDIVRVWDSPGKPCSPEEVLSVFVVHVIIRTKAGEKAMKCTCRLQLSSTYLHFLLLLKNNKLLPDYVFDFNYFKRVKKTWVQVNVASDIMPTKECVLVVIKERPQKAPTPPEKTVAVRKTLKKLPTNPA